MINDWLSFLTEETNVNDETLFTKYTHACLKQLRLSYQKNNKNLIISIYNCSLEHKWKIKTLIAISK